MQCHHFGPVARVSILYQLQLVNTESGLSTMSFDLGRNLDVMYLNLSLFNVFLELVLLKEWQGGLFGFGDSCRYNVYFARFIFAVLGGLGASDVVLKVVHKFQLLSCWAGLWILFMLLFGLLETKPLLFSSL
ncbi:hypothetical protein GOP47_0024358 [Adiantum capillus-veneris]|uniref:Uncharacterized protein n=1 Tax=Adiantum capillus-veneris TaxID=13818 RepID=A0A9D4U204_ADICA|nr:hypothetical protein GOP47_0024358 [Adiantum capillus-veneris]